MFDRTFFERQFFEHAQLFCREQKMRITFAIPTSSEDGVLSLPAKP